VCDRHFGVGADGVLAILPGIEGDARMRVLNADGSEAEMCGNGIRCVAKVLFEDDANLRKSVIRIDTGAGLLDCAVDAQDTQVATVAVQMGHPRLSRPEIPMGGEADASTVRSRITIADREFVFTAVSMGNPHVVIFIDEPSADLRNLATTYGPRIENAPLFPKRTNVEFARIRGNEIDLVVWERGCGITLACGTGACATVVAAYLEGRLPGNQETPVHLLGGALFITVDTGAEPAQGTPDMRPKGVAMRGPARRVFTAELNLPETH
jgi:diaminopimelate epimerase